MTREEFRHLLLKDIYSARSQRRKYDKRIDEMKKRGDYRSRKFYKTVDLFGKWCKRLDEAEARLKRFDES